MAALTVTTKRGLTLQDKIRGIDIQPSNDPFLLFRRDRLAAEILFKRRNAMHSISPVLKTVRRLVNHVAIRVKARSQSTFPPVHARRTSKNMDRRKVPQISKRAKKKGDGSLADDDSSRQTREASRPARRTYFHVLSLTLYWLATIGWLVSLSRSPVLS